MDKSSWINYYTKIIIKHFAGIEIYMQCLRSMDIINLREIHRFNFLDANDFLNCNCTLLK